MSRLNEIVADDCEALLSSNSLSGLMALKKVCMYSESDRATWRPNKGGWGIGCCHAPHPVNVCKRSGLIVGALVTWAIYTQGQLLL